MFQKSKMADYLGYMELVKARADVVLEEIQFSGGAIDSSYSFDSSDAFYNTIHNKGYNNGIVKVITWNRDEIKKQGIDQGILEKDEYFIIVYDPNEFITIDVLYSAGCGLEGNRYYSMNDFKVALKRSVNIVNFIEDGSFEKMWSDETNNGWVVNNINSILDTSVRKSGNTSLKLIGSSTTGETVCVYEPPKQLAKNSKYYVCMYIKGDEQSLVDNNFAFYYYAMGEGINLKRTNNVDNGWIKYSCVFDTPETFGLYLRVDNDNWQTNQTVWFDELCLINLTETFGKGKEPDKHWCDENLEYGVTQVAVPVGE